MKQILNFKLQFLAIVALVAMLASPAAHAQVAPTTTTTLTLTSGTNWGPATSGTVAASGTATVTSQAFSPNSLTGFSVIPNIALSGTGTGNVTFSFQGSLDGTNWTTTYPITFTVAATGTTAAVGYYSFAPSISGSAANNIPYWRLGQVVNANTPSVLTINSITISKSNR